MRWLVLAGFAALLLAGAPALAGDKPLHGVALVIGESRYEQLPACELATYEEQLKHSGWKPPGLGATHPSGNAMR